MLRFSSKVILVFFTEQGNGIEFLGKFQFWLVSEPHFISILIELIQILWSRIKLKFEDDEFYKSNLTWIQLNFMSFIRIPIIKVAISIWPHLESLRKYKYHHHCDKPHTGNGTHLYEVVYVVLVLLLVDVKSIINQKFELNYPLELL